MSATYEVGLVINKDPIDIQGNPILRPYRNKHTWDTVLETENQLLFYSVVNSHEISGLLEEYNRFIDKKPNPECFYFVKVEGSCIAEEAGDMSDNDFNMGYAYKIEYSTPVYDQKMKMLINKILKYGIGIVLILLYILLLRNCL